MAFNNNNYNNNNKNKNTEREVFSDIKYYNPESEVDPGMLSISFWNGLMKISISPVDKSTLNSSTQRYDHDNGGVIYIRPIEAYMLSMEIDKIFDGVEITTTSVLNTKKDAILSFGFGTEYGISSLCLSIKQIDAEGNVLSTYVYKFRQDHSAIRDFNHETKEFNKFMYTDAEALSFRNTLYDFYRNMNGAAAYGVIHYNRFDTSRINTKLNLVAEKLGIQMGKSENGNGYNRSSVFDKSPERETHFETVNPDEFDLD